MYVVRALIASTTDRLKYSLNIQKPGSLTWEKAIEPQETASTMTSGWTPLPASSGSATPEAVTTATVAEPRATRRMAAISQARMRGETDQCAVESLM